MQTYQNRLVTVWVCIFILFYILSNDTQFLNLLTYGLPKVLLQWCTGETKV